MTEKVPTHRFGRTQVDNHGRRPVARCGGKVNRL